MTMTIRLFPHFIIVITCLLAACGDRGGDSERLKVGVAFESLETEFWVAGWDAIRNELQERNIEVLEALADGDPNKQFEQIRSFITRGVDGIILVPKDGKTCIPMIKAANRADIPIVLFNRPAAESDVEAVTVVADNRPLAKATVDFMVEEARKTGEKHKAMIVLGDLGDSNAVGRRDGFDDAVTGNEDIIEVVARVPSNWDQETARANVANAITANPDISFLFTSSDFLFPSIVSALKAAGKYKKRGEEGHVILGGFDGDATAYQMLIDGYLDATGVQDVYFEAESAVQAILDMIEGKPVDDMIRDPGFVIHQGNREEVKDRTWGANVKAFDFD